MNPLPTVFTLLPWSDWAALACFVCAWVGYASFAHRRSKSELSLLAATNRIRREWMLQATYREVRVVDGVVVQNLSSSTTFFASTTILIIGGLLAVLGTTEKVTGFVSELPFAARTSVLVFDLKIIVLLVVFIYAFFRFTWSLRQYSFGALLVASAPESKRFDELDERVRLAFADRAGRAMGLAAEAFNAGLRAYYMAFAAIGWFFSPLVFVIATAIVVAVLYQREFRSEMNEVLRGDD